MIDIDKIEIEWSATGDAEYIYFTVINERTFHIRLNDFPAEPMYTLIFEKIVIIDFDDWPEVWKKPS